MSVLSVLAAACMQDPDIAMFRDSVRRFYERNAPAERVARWREAGAA